MAPHLILYCKVDRYRPIELLVPRQILVLIHIWISLPLLVHLKLMRKKSNVVKAPDIGQIDHHLSKQFAQVLTEMLLSLQNFSTLSLWWCLIITNDTGNFHPRKSLHYAQDALSIAMTRNIFTDRTRSTRLNMYRKRIWKLSHTRHTARLLV